MRQHVRQERLHQRHAVRAGHLVAGCPRHGPPGAGHRPVATGDDLQGPQGGEVDGPL